MHFLIYVFDTKGTFSDGRPLTSDEATTVFANAFARSQMVEARSYLQRFSYASAAVFQDYNSEPAAPCLPGNIVDQNPG